MDLTMEEIQELMVGAATLAIEKYVAGKGPELFPSKTALAKHLNCNRKTITSMISRNEVLKTRDGKYKLNIAKPKLNDYPTQSLPAQS